MNVIEELRKEIFRCRLNGSPIVIDMLVRTDAEKESIRRLLWEVGIAKLAKEDFFDLAQNRNEIAKAVYTHPLVIRNDYDRPAFVPAGRTHGVTYGAYKLLNPGKVT